MKRKNHSKLLKIVSLMLSVIMVLGMTSMFVSADTVPVGSKDKVVGYITVGGIEESATATAYRLMTVDFDYSANQPNDPEFYWVDNDKLKAFVNEKYPGIVNSDGSVNMPIMNGIKDDTTNNKSITFFDQIASAIRSGKIDITESGSVNGNDKIENLEMGGYLVLIEGGEKVYRASAVNVVPLYSDSKWVVDCPTIQVKSSETQIEKKILTATGNSVDKSVASIGDTINFEIITKVPKYPMNAIHKTYTVGDKAVSGFTIKSDTIKVYGEGTQLLDNTGDKYYKLTVTDANDFEVAFKYDAIKNYSSITVKYDALLDNKADIGENGNENDAFLTYSNNPYGTKDSVKKYEDSAIVYTYGFDLTKVDKSNTSKKLTGAEFTLYLDEDLKNSIAFTGTDGSYIKRDGTEEDVTVTTVKVDENGKLILKGLKTGTYYLKETKAPSGYNIQRDPFQIMIYNDNDFIATDRNEGRFENGLVTKNIENSNGFALPTTGDMGTILFAAGGVALVALGAVLVIMARRRSKNADAA